MKYFNVIKGHVYCGSSSQISDDNLALLHLEGQKGEYRETRGEQSLEVRSEVVIGNQWQSYLVRGTHSLSEVVRWVWIARGQRQSQVDRSSHRQSGVVIGSQGQSQLVRGSQKQFGVVRGSQGQLEVVRGSQRYLGVVRGSRGSQRSSEVFRGSQRQSGVVRGSQRQSGVVIGIQGWSSVFMGSQRQSVYLLY